MKWPESLAALDRQLAAAERFTGSIRFTSPPRAAQLEDLERRYLVEFYDFGAGRAGSRTVFPARIHFAALNSLARHADRLARGLAHVVNLIDPNVIVLGGGLSKLDSLYATLPDLIRPHVFADEWSIEVRPPKHGDDSGVRGAARLWTHSA